MATYFRNAVSPGIGITPVTVLQTTSSNSFTVIGLNIANVTSGLVNVDITFTNATPVTSNYLKGVSIPPNTSLKVITNGEKLVVSSSCSVAINSNTPASVDVVISYVEVV